MQNNCIITHNLNQVQTSDHLPEKEHKRGICIFDVLAFWRISCFSHYSRISSSDAVAAENVTMTLTELSVYIKKQELELQLRTEKEKEEGEYRHAPMRRTGSGQYRTQQGNYIEGIGFKIRIHQDQMVPCTRRPNKQKNRCFKSMLHQTVRS